MTRFPKKLQKKLARREAQNALRHLPQENSLVDFSSNDYLGFSKNREIAKNATERLSKAGIVKNGATGSRLLSGNHKLYDDLEEILLKFHEAESALVFNSGYDANIGFFSAVPQRGDIIFFDEYIHASIRDGIKLGNAKSYKFKHNDINDLKLKCDAERSRKVLGGPNEREIYIVTESVFSMDGDSPDLKAFTEFCTEHNCHLVVDEAHAVGIFGEKGEGLVQRLGLQNQIFARIITFGKAMGCHGAAILGSKELKRYLVNFARSLIYTTGLTPHSVAAISSAYMHLDSNQKAQNRLMENIVFFNSKLETLALSEIERVNLVSPGGRLKPFFIRSNSAIHCCVIAGNEKVKSIAEKIQNTGFDIRPIRSPTVPEGQERLRICLHSFNTKEEIQTMLEIISSSI